MAEAYSPYVVESHGGRTRAYVKGWVDSETDKTATVYVWGCAEGAYLAQYGVRTRVYVNGEEVDTAADAIFSAYEITKVAEASGKLTVCKEPSARTIEIACSIEGEEVDGYGPIAGSVTARAAVSVGAKVLTPPSAPTDLTVVRNAAANIELSWTSGAGNAASTLVERCMKGGSWEQIAEREGESTGYVDSPGVGSFKYRVRYWNEDGYSGYSNETDYVATLCPPAAPTLVSPPSGSTVDANSRTVLLSWRHNPIDSSPQTAAEVYWSNDNATFSTVEVGASENHPLAIEGRNETIYWKVRTKGADAEYGPPSGVAHFNVRTAPVAILHVPATVEALPVLASWEYEDAMGRQTSALLEIVEEDGTAAFWKALAGESSYAVTASDFTPEQGKTYLVRLSVTSSTSLSYRTQAAMTVDYTPPARPSLSVATNARKAENRVTVFEGAGEADAPPTTFVSVFRDGTLLAENLCPGQSFVDTAPPLDRPVVYTAFAYAESGAAASRSETVVVRSNGFAFFNFGGKVAKVGMNIKLSDQTVAEKEHYAVASSKYRKVFYGEHSERTGTISADVFWAHDALGYGEEAMLSAIEQLKEHAGPVRLRLPYADSFDADTSVSIERSTGTYNVAAVAVDWRRVE